MRHVFTPRRDILPPAQRRLWPQLRQAAARQIFGTNFPLGESLKALIYFDDGDLNTLTAAEQQFSILSKELGVGGERRGSAASPDPIARGRRPLDLA